MQTNMMLSEHISDSFFYFDDFAHEYQEINDIVRRLETTKRTYFRFGTMEADYSHLLYAFKL